VPPTPPPPPDRSSHALDELTVLLFRCADGYRWAIDAEEWSAAFEYGQLIDRIDSLLRERAA
jgi:hypothetical protein